MFTGIVQERGSIFSVEKRGGITHLSIFSEKVFETAEIGDSVSINGACLTVTSKEKGIMLFDISEETMKSTNLGTLKRGNKVNLEPALRSSDRLGGHFVTGHIDGVGRIKNKLSISKTTKVEIEAPEEVMRFIVRKGSIAVDGISLTVVDVYKDFFTVIIIPHTEKVTTIGTKEINDTVNLETDIIGKYAAKFTSRIDTENKTLMQKLEESGFLEG